MFLFCLFKELIDVGSQVLKKLGGELGDYKEAKVRVKVVKVSWEEIFTMEDAIEDYMHWR